MLEFLKKFKTVIYLIIFCIFLYSIKSKLIDSLDPLTLRSFWDFVFVTEKNKLNWVALGALGVFISYWISVRENAKKIDADLKAKARIEWIQEVRKLASNFITNLSQYIQSNNVKWSEIENGKNLLILYFGPDSKGVSGEIKNQIYVKDNEIIVTKEAKDILYKYNNNNNKNGYIIRYLELLYSFYNNPIRNKALQSIKDYNDDINFIYGEADYEFDYTSLDENGYPKITGVVLNPQEKKSIESLEKKIEDLNNFADAYKYDLSFFTEVMRIYFKVEWNIAKNGN